MKKVLLTLAVGLSLGYTAYAQKPESGNDKFSLEGQIGASFGGGSNLFSAPTLKGRFFFKDNMAIRLGVGMNFSKVSQDYYENADGTGGVGTIEISSALYTLKPGFEYHMGSYEKFSPYVGAEITIGLGSDKTERTNVGPFGSYDSDYSETAESSLFNYQTNVLAGMDYYFAKNVYFGAEFGIGYSLSSNKGEERTITTGGVTTIEKGGDRSTAGFANNAVGGLRLGWRF